MEVSIRKEGAAYKALPNVSCGTLIALTAVAVFLFGAGMYAFATAIAAPALAYIAVDTTAKKGGEL